MLRTFFTVAFLAGGCVAPNPNLPVGSTASPPGLVDWCAFRHHGTVSCFAWAVSGGSCLEWGCEDIPRELCPPETVPWEFACAR